MSDVSHYRIVAYPYSPIPPYVCGECGRPRPWPWPTIGAADRGSDGE